MNIQHKLHWWFFASSVLAGGGTALMVVADHRGLKALGAYLAVFNGLYAIQWLAFSIRAAIEDQKTK